MSEEIQYRKTISHTLVLHDPLSQGHILPMSKGEMAVVAKPMFSRGKFLQNVAQNVCGDKGKKKGMALTISDNLCRPFVWDECNREVHSNRTEENQFFFRSPNS